MTFQTLIYLFFLLSAIPFTVGVTLRLYLPLLFVILCPDISKHLFSCFSNFSVSFKSSCLSVCSVYISVCFYISLNLSVSLIYLPVCLSIHLDLALSHTRKTFIHDFLRVFFSLFSVKEKGRKKWRGKLVAFLEGGKTFSLAWWASTRRLEVLYYVFPFSFLFIFYMIILGAARK